MIKAVFFDIDGTLVSFKTHKLPDSTVRALDLLREKGIKVFIATGDGFTFTGTTLKNFDAEKSKAKTVRKPELLAAVPMNLSSLNKFFGDIKAVEGAVNGRFNENTIILTVG